MAVAIVAAYYLAGLGHPFGNGDEVIYAEFIRDMQRSGAYLTHSQVYLQRPPTAVAAYALLGNLVPGEIGLRLLPALLSIATAILVLCVAWRMLGWQAGVVGMFLFVGSPTVYCYGRTLMTDPPFVLATTAALVATVLAQQNPRFFSWACVALGGAFAVKSFAAAVPAASLAPWLVRVARRHRGSPTLKLGRGVAGFLLLATPYYLYGLARFGRQFVDIHLGHNLIGRARGQLEGVGLGGPLSYLRHLWLFDGPVVSIVLLGAVVAAAAWAAARRDEKLGVPAWHALACLVGLSVMKTRLPHYLLIFFPAAAICAGGLVSRVFGTRPRTAGADSRGVSAHVLLAPVLSLSLFARTLANPSADGFMLPATQATVLGRAARQMSSLSAYTLDWYAPAFAYYAEKPWRLLATDARLARIVEGVDVFREAKTVLRAPPWPAGRMLVATSRDRLARSGLKVLREIAADGDYVLVEAEAPAAY